MTSLEELAAFAQGLADTSGAVIRPFFRATLDVTDKAAGLSGFDPVTVADREAELAMRRAIKARFPAHGILGEEHGHEPGTDRHTWVLDPIDGTRAFICGMAQWGTLIALNDGDNPVLGILDQPITHERWIGHGTHAELVTPEGRRPIHVRTCASLSAAVITTTHPTAYFTASEQAAFQRLAAEARMSRFGGDCYAYGLLAMGFIDLVVESSLKAWDVQALIPIIRAAGGIVTAWDGGDPQNGGRVIAAGDPRVHAEALAVLSRVH